MCCFLPARAHCPSTNAMTAKRKPTTTEQLSLAFELYHRIPRGRKVTAQELQTELSHAGITRDIRTIQRNLDVVAQYLDVDKDTRNKPYGYSRQLTSQFVLGPRESIVLQLAKAMISDALPDQLHYAVESAFQPILNHQRSYPGLQRTEGESTKAGTHSKLCPAKTVKELVTIFEPLSLALTYQRLITITLKTGETIESMMPLGLLLSFQSFHLIYQSDDNTFDIALHHVAEIKVLTFHFDYPADFKLHQYSLQPELYGKRIDLDSDR
ncbi:TPA: hypothetical protein ACRZ3R_004413 [Vibrio harveyi]